jgi:hypothetical protein
VKPSTSKAQRFADLLHDAGTGTPLSEERLVELQNAVVDPRFAEASYRQIQNWVGNDYGYRARIDFVPPLQRIVKTIVGIRISTRPAIDRNIDIRPTRAARL